MPPKKAYFDTNIYNYLLDDFSLDDVKALSKKIKKSNIKIYLSPINIIEFLQNQNDLRHERLVHLCQLICDSNLLVEPEYLIVDYIAESTNDPKIKHLALQDFVSRNDLGTVWLKIKSNALKTFVFEKEDIKRLQILKDLVSYYHAHYSRGGSLKDIFSEAISISLQKHLKAYAVQKRDEPVPSDRQIKLLEHAYILTTQLLCDGCTLFPSRIDDYWNSIAIHGAHARINFAFEKLNFLTQGGPFIGMGAMMAWQATQKYNAGNLFDCYHLLYIPYVDVFVTRDNAFHDLREVFNASQALGSIKNFEDFISLDAV